MNLIHPPWLSATSGHFRIIVLDRDPQTAEEHDWVETEIKTRLEPNGMLLVGHVPGAQP